MVQLHLMQFLRPQSVGILATPVLFDIFKFLRVRAVRFQPEF